MQINKNCFSIIVILMNSTFVFAQTSPVITPSSSAGVSQNIKGTLDLNIFTISDNDLIAIQSNGLTKDNMSIYLYDLKDKLIASTMLYQGSTIAYLDTKKLYGGEYSIHILNGTDSLVKKITLVK